MGEQYIISHPKYGEYIQIVSDTPEEAGHRKLPSEGRYGWGMPSDPAAEEFVSITKDRIVFEVGSGLGNIIALPSLKRGAALVYAADINQQSLSMIAKEANALVGAGVLKTQVLDESWWEGELQANPSVSSILSVPAGDSIPYRCRLFSRCPRSHLPRGVQAGGAKAHRARRSTVALANARTGA